MSRSTTVSIPDIESFKKKALHWANHFKVACLLDSNQYPHYKYKSKDWILAADAVDYLICGENAFDELKKFQSKAHSTIFGFFSYDLKNQIDKLESHQQDGIMFPELYFFKPRYIIEITGDKVTINRNYPETYEIIEHIQKLRVHNHKSHAPIKLERGTSKEKYLQNVELIRKQIKEGDFYELNYCNEFFAAGLQIDTVEVFLRLNEKAKAPFSCFFKLKDKFLLCASPERFLKKEGYKLISQPIKGTIRRAGTAEENKKLKAQLQKSAKERAENVMIVDLVRNDLSKSSQAGSVKVEELFGIYEFNTVNQMISSVSSELNKGVHFVDAIRNAFPMGSMTGAPKLEVMKNIENYEDFKRCLYSGSVGYITPEGDFDLNVVIRSIFYNASEKYVSVRVGGAITYNSVPEKEYEEILLKAKSLMEALDAELIN